jgi:hypothetical protein
MAQGAAMEGWGRPSLLGYVIVAAALGVGIALYETRGTFGPLREGATIEGVFTLVTSDRDDFVCASATTLDGYSCPFIENGTPRDASARGTLMPAVTVDHHLFLVANLFSDPALAARYDAEPPTPRREPLHRFEAYCTLHVVGQMPAEVRPAPDRAWGPSEVTWVVAPRGCRVEDVD